MENKIPNTKKIAGVSVNLDTPPKRKELTALIAKINPHYSEEEIKDSIDGSKLYNRIPVKNTVDTIKHEPVKDSERHTGTEHS